MDKLPTELKDIVFDALQKPNDVCNLRLVNKQLANAGKSHLVRRLVLAKRLPAIQKFIGVLQDPMLRSRIKELVYDTSEYKTCVEEDEVKWYNWDTFWQTAAPHIKDANTPLQSLPSLKTLDNVRNYCTTLLQDLNQAERTIVYRTTFSTLREQDVYRLRQYCDAEGLNFGLAPGTDHQCNDSFTVDNKRSPAAQDFRVPNFDYAHLYTNPNSVRYLQAFGAHVGFSEQQLAIEQMGIVPSLIIAACKKLPGLEKLTFTDHRGLARNGESYDGLCQRIFGNHAAPLPPAHPAECLQLLYQVVDAWSHLGILQRLETGTHIFIADREHREIDDFDQARPHWIDGSFDDIILSGVLAGFGDRLRLRQVRCHLYMDESDDDQDGPISLGLRDLLAFSSETLTHLTLSTQACDIVGDLMELEQLPNYFPNLLSTLQLPHLKHLSLTSWLLDLHTFKAFLLAHSATLKHLHLIRCILVAEEVDRQELIDFPTWVGQTLNFAGVEVFGVERRIKTPATSLQGRPFVEIWGSVNPEYEWDGRCVWDHGFESECLAGRRSLAVAQARPARELMEGEREGEVKYYW